MSFFSFSFHDPLSFTRVISSDAIASLFSTYKAISPSSLLTDISLFLSSSLALWLSGSLKTSIYFFLFSPFLSRYFYNDDFFLFLFLF